MRSARLSPCAGVLASVGVPALTLKSGFDLGKHLLFEHTFDYTSLMVAVPLEHPEIGAAYASIMRQLEEVHSGFTVTELKTVVRYLDSVKDVR